MKARLLLLIDNIRASYWFIPAIMLAGSMILALLLVAIDERIETERLRGIWWIFSGGAEGARALLSTVAGSVIAVAGTTFSITIAVLSLTSSQFGPRLLRGFMRDTSNQFVLGTFVATFLYCLLVLRMVRSVEETYFVPHIAVTAGVLLAIASVCVLIYFIHHVSVSIQAHRVIAGVAWELEKAIERLFPDEIGQAVAFPHEPPDFDNKAANSQDVSAETSGYVQVVDGDALLALAVEHDLRIALVPRPGQFVVRGSTLARVVPAGDAPPDVGAGTGDIAHGIHAAITLGEQRTAAQDVEFLILQLVEVAVRALSPGINDPFTAVMCLDRLSAALCHLAGRAFPSGQRVDEQGAVRILARPVSFAALVETAFGEIRHYGGEDPVIVRRLRQALQEIGECARNEEQQNTLREEASRLD